MTWIRSEEYRSNMSEILMGENHPFFGKHLSDDHRQKISEALKKIKRTPEHNKKLADAKRGKALSQIHKKKISASLKGIPISLETRQKLCEFNIQGFWYGNVRYYDGPQYCEKFNENLKERVRAFFGYHCIECGTPQGKDRLDVHHVWYNKKSCCDNSPRSLVPLCHSCHSSTTNGNHKYWSSHFQEIIDTYYGGKCWFLREEMIMRQ